MDSPTKKAHLSALSRFYNYSMAIIQVQNNRERVIQQEPGWGPLVDVRVVLHALNYQEVRTDSGGCNVDVLCRPVAKG